MLSPFGILFLTLITGGQCDYPEETGYGPDGLYSKAYDGISREELQEAAAGIVAYREELINTRPFGNQAYTDSYSNNSYLYNQEHLYNQNYNTPRLEYPTTGANPPMSRAIIPVRPSNMPSMPQNLPALPSTMPGFPQNVPALPSNMPGFPQNVPAFPSTMPGFPQNVPAFPPNRPSIPTNRPSIPPNRPVRPPSMISGMSSNKKASQVDDADDSDEDISQVMGDMNLNQGKPKIPSMPANFGPKMAMPQNMTRPPRRMDMQMKKKGSSSKQQASSESEDESEKKKTKEKGSSSKEEVSSESDCSKNKKKKGLFRNLSNLRNSSKSKKTDSD